MSNSFKVHIKSWTAVAVWRWITNDVDCGICRLPFDGCCPDCKIPGDDCPLGNTYCNLIEIVFYLKVSGQCRHQFHMHCIIKWLQTQQMQQQCPMCRQNWQFSE